MAGTPNPSLRRAPSADRRCREVSPALPFKLLIALFSLVLCSCETTLTGPSPSLPTTTVDGPLSPAFACNEQVETIITVQGDAFTPLVIQTPSSPRTLLPDLRLTRRHDLLGSSTAPVEQFYPGDTEAGERAGLLRWNRGDEMAFTLRPDHAFETGLYTVTLTNPQGKHAETPDALAVVPKPSMDTVTPGIHCLDEESRSLEVKGSDLLIVAGEEAKLHIEGTELTFAVDRFEDCIDLAHPGVPAQHCETAHVTLAAMSVPVGLHTLSINNPEPAACRSVDPIQLRIAPSPAITEIEPSIVSPVQSQMAFEIRGTDFLKIDDQLPTVSVTNEAGEAQDVVVEGLTECEVLETQGHTVERCQKLAAQLPQMEVSAPYSPTISITNPNPAGCSGATSTDLVLVPAPQLIAVNPPMVCKGQETVQVVLSGTHFFVIDDEVPTVQIDAGTATSVLADDCEPLSVPRRQVQNCQRLEVTFDPSGFDRASLTVTNPSPAGGTDQLEQRIVSLAPPVVDRFSPSLLCLENGAREFTVFGSHLREIQGSPPQVQVSDYVVEQVLLSDCEDATEGALSWRQCESIRLTLPQGVLDPGLHTIQVTDAEPAGCQGRSETQLRIAPQISLLTAAPQRVCLADQAMEVTVQGTGFLRLDGVDPAVTLGDRAFPASFEECVDLPTPGVEAVHCTIARTEIPQNALGPGPVTVRIDNPGDATCDASAEDLFEVVPVPRLDAVAPVTACSEGGSRQIRLSGSQFVEGTEVRINDDAVDVAYVDGENLDITLPDRLLPGTYTLTVDNGSGCDDVLEQALEIKPNPTVFFVDPPVVYTGVSLQTTIFTAGLEAAPNAVVALGPEGETLSLDFQITPGRPNKLLATLPAGLSAGTWGIRVTSQLECEGALEEAVTLTDDLSVGLGGIEPAYVSSQQPTAVVITPRDPLGPGEVGFTATPRLYLSPNPAAPDVLATALRAVVHTGMENPLTAVIPGGLSPGSYDLILVNPEGTVGLLEAGVTVTVDNPPILDGIEPASFDGNAPQTARLTGSGFDTEGGVTVMMECQDVNGARSQADAAIDAGTLTSTSVSVTLPSDQFSAGSVCVISLQNADGAYSRYSAISIKTPAQNLDDWTVQEAMTEARRSPGLTAGRPTRTSRYLYAIGGDGGALESASSTVEAAPVDIYGNMGAWSQQRNPLPGPRTLAQAVTVDGFVYLIGGNDGQGSVDTVLRARLLDPLAGPMITDLSLQLQPEADEGMAAGLWHYQVAAVFPADDPHNPNGEGLGGEVFVLQLPAVDGLYLQLEWDPIPGASGYRLYRTPTPGAPAADLALLAELQANELTYVDSGSSTGLAQPLPPGSLGRWHEAGRLDQPREAAGVVIAPRENDVVVYAFGGHNNGIALDSYSYALIGNGTPINFATGDQTIGVARSELQGFIVDNADVGDTIPVGSPWVFVGPGRTQGGFSRQVTAAEVQADGSLSAFVETDNVIGDFSGYGAGAANGYLYVFGGSSGQPSDSGISARLCLSANSPGCRQAPDEPPDLVNWNGLGSRLAVPRAYMGSAQESAFFFVAGGMTANGVTTAVDRTVQ